MAYKTNYSEAWKAYKKSKEFKASMDVLTKKGHQPVYAENILNSAFTAGWGNRKIYAV